MKNHYIQAVIDLIEDGRDPSEIIKGLKKNLQEKGYESILPSVLHGVLKRLSAKSQNDSTTVTVARKSDLEKYSKMIKDALQEMGVDDSYETCVDENIIGGYIVKNKNKVVDNSYKKVLANLYHKITKK